MKKLFILTKFQQKFSFSFVVKWFYLELTQVLLSSPQLRILIKQFIFENLEKFVNDFDTVFVSQSGPKLPGLTLKTTS